MSDITFRSDFDVDLIDYMGSDERICAAARVSTKGAQVQESYEGEALKANTGLINALIRERHGSPLESSVMQWRITAPIMVWREFMRHRIASYSEESGRYKQLDPVFYIPPRHRPLVQVGKAMAYDLQPGDDEQYEAMVQRFQNAHRFAYQVYLDGMRDELAKEVARISLPVGIYSTAYVTMNIRALLNFLSLRVRATPEEAAYPSKPQWEINQVANAMEVDFETAFPITHAAFVEHKRVAP